MFSHPAWLPSAVTGTVLTSCLLSFEILMKSPYLQIRELKGILELGLKSIISLYPVSSPWSSADVELPEPVTVSHIAVDSKHISTLYRAARLDLLVWDSYSWFTLTQAGFGGSRLISESFRIFAFPFAYLNWARTEAISRDNRYVLLGFFPPYGWFHHPLTFSRGQKWLGDALKVGVWLLQTMFLLAG